MLLHRVRSLIVPAAVALVLVACGASPQAPASSQDSSEIESCSFPPPTGSCSDQCAALSGQVCIECCGGSANECAAATATCFDSCARGVGPWLPC